MTPRERVEERARVPALIVFARAPVPGATKTRLAAVLGRERAAALSLAFLEDTLDHALRTGFAVRVQAAGDLEHPSLVSVCESRAVPLEAQAGGSDLGSRMSSALHGALGRHERALLIGSDAPTLSSVILREAEQSLDAGAVVIGPAADGGYCLIGLARAGTNPLAPSLSFDGVRWSTRHALADTLGCLRGFSVRLVSPWYDVDDLEGLRILRMHLSLDPAAAPITARALGVSADRAF